MNKESSVRRLRSEIVYGPVCSRRFGNSLGINISGKSKYCSFNCLYCFRGKNDGSPESTDFLKMLPSVDMVIDSFKKWLINTYETVDDITIAGNAEPTNHPDFPEIVEEIIRLRDRHLPQVRISVLTNGTGLLPRMNNKYRYVQHALEKINQPCLKLDSGVPETWQKISMPYGNITFSEWFDSVKILNNPIIQTMLMKGIVNNTSDNELTHLKKCYEMLNPKGIQVLNINKPTAVSGVYPVERIDFRKAKNFLTNW